MRDHFIIASQRVVTLSSFWIDRLCNIDNVVEIAPVCPSSAEELAATLSTANAQKSSVCLLGSNSKPLMGGPVSQADIYVSTTALDRVLEYEPRDLTVSVQAGMPFLKLQETLAAHKQRIALDPPSWRGATVGGIVATNSSGPLRRGFGTVRDSIIGMTFATLDGSLVRTGGQVVKNVAGLDMGKLMIGSFGTLAAITSINFRVHTMPEFSQTFVFNASTLDDAVEQCTALLGSPLQPKALELISPLAADRFGHQGFLAALLAEGSAAVLNRYKRELSNWHVLNEDAAQAFWGKSRSLTPDYLRQQPGVTVLRVVTPTTELSELLRLASAPAVSRFGSGVTHLYLPSSDAVQPIVDVALRRGWTVVVEHSSNEFRQARTLWHQGPENGFEVTLGMMARIKEMFDPLGLLNRNRMYGRI
jgi:glycolate oxidase FAD binding subunit